MCKIDTTLVIGSSRLGMQNEGYSQKTLKEVLGMSQRTRNVVMYHLDPFNLATRQQTLVDTEELLSYQLISAMRLVKMSACNRIFSGNDPTLSASTQLLERCHLLKW